MESNVDIILKIVIVVFGKSNESRVSGQCSASRNSLVQELKLTNIQVTWHR